MLQIPRYKVVVDCTLTAEETKNILMSRLVEIISKSPSSCFDLKEFQLVCNTLMHCVTKQSAMGLLGQLIKDGRIRKIPEDEIYFVNYS